MTRAEAEARCEMLEFLSDLIALYYTRHATGGSLHIVLDDGNLDDDAIARCLKSTQETRDYEGEAIAKCLLELSLDERKAMYEHRYFVDGVTQGWGSGIVQNLVWGLARDA